MLLIVPSWLSKFAIPRTRGGAIEGRADFNIADVESQLVVELSERQRLGTNKVTSSDGVRSPTWLRVASYQLIQILYANRREDELWERIHNHKRLRVGTPHPDRDLFKDGLVGLFARHPGVMLDSDRMVAPMWHGFRHYIPPSLLAGFNSQYPRHKGRSDGWRAEIEPSLEGWVIEQRAYSIARECNLDQHRGVYPTSISNVVEGIFELKSAEDSQGGRYAKDRDHNTDGWD